MKNILKDLVNTQKYKMRINTLELEIDHIKKAHEELKVMKIDELFSYKEKYETAQRQLEASRKKVKSQKEIIKEGVK